MVREIEQGLYLWDAAVEFLEGGLQLGRDVADELRLQGIVLVGQLDVLLLLTGQKDESHEYHAANYQCSCECSCQDAESYNDHRTGRDRAVLVGDGGLVVGNLLLQRIDLVGMFHGDCRIFPGDIVRI